ncbi:MAG: DinB family protein [Candidatus Bathyarchaeota archaeon]|nr:MAG: DinB family protein [Candidatus Bathyarchaeota archaeon]
MDDQTSYTISESLLETFKLTWDMCEDAIVKIPDEHWRTGDVDYLMPARLMYHILETADFYSSPEPEGFPWGQRFDADCWDALPERLPSKDQALEYHREVREKVNGWLHGIGDTGLLSPETAFPWTGSSVLCRALYILAHYRQHLGEINAELRRRGLPRVEWRTY